jgi:methionyl-tRNA formyltransferase
MIDIVYFATSKIAVESLVSLSKCKEINIKCVVTQIDKKAGRKKELLKSPIKIVSEKLGIKLIQPKNLDDLESKLNNVKTDFFVVFAFGMIFSKKLLSIPKKGCINVHTSILPKYRGASPIQEALLNNDSYTGISFMKMDSELDHGPIYMVKKVQIENDNLVSLTNKLAYETAKLLPFVLIDIYEENLNPIPQSHANATYCKKISKKDGLINLNKKSLEICGMVNAYNPWPGSYIFLPNKKKLNILEAKISDKNVSEGEIVIEGKQLFIGTVDGSICPLIVQLEGKKVMGIADFLNGYRKLFIL